MPTLADDLRADIARGQAVFICGIGVSASATRDPARSPDPITWQGLLRLGVSECRKLVPDLDEAWERRREEAIASLDLDEMLSAAELVSRKLDAPRGGDFRRWLRECFSGIPIVDPSVPEALAALAALGAPLFTTNYDDVLERVTGLPALTQKDPADVERVLRGEERAIVHMHGFYKRPETVVLGIRSYEDLLRDPSAQAIQRAVRTLRTLVFVGVGQGLEDPNLGSLLAWSREIFAGSETRHYLLCRTSERAALQAKHPTSERLYAVSYGDAYSDLAPFLRSLASPAAPPSPPPVTPPPPPNNAPPPAVAASPAPRVPVPVVILHAPEDAGASTELRTALTPLVQAGILALWSEVDIDPGATREAVITRKIGEAALVLILVSASSIAAEPLRAQWLLAMSGQVSGTKVVPVLLAPSLWAITELGALKPLPADGSDIASARSRDRAWQSVAESVLRLYTKAGASA
ncbi:MAG: SIR2 family protein [Polyangiaceae bacterium]